MYVVPMAPNYRRTPGRLSSPLNTKFVEDDDPQSLLPPPQNTPWHQLPSHLRNRAQRNKANRANRVQRMQNYISKREQKFMDLGYSSDTVSRTTDSDETDREDSDLEYGELGCTLRRQRRRDEREKQRLSRAERTRGKSAPFVRPGRLNDDE
jgi:hypothetical protein